MSEGAWLLLLFLYAPRWVESVRHGWLRGPVRAADLPASRVFGYELALGGLLLLLVVASPAFRAFSGVRPDVLLGAEMVALPCALGAWLVAWLFGLARDPGPRWSPDRRTRRWQVAQVVLVEPFNEELLLRGVLVVGVHQATQSWALAWTAGAVAHFARHPCHGVRGVAWQLLAFAVSTALATGPWGTLAAVAFRGYLRAWDGGLALIRLRRELGDPTLDLV